MVKIGDLVKMNRGYSARGVVLEVVETVPHTAIWARVLWSDEGLGLEKVRDLEVICEAR
jgi:hypothetical protein